MDAPLNIVIGVVATALPLGFLIALLLRGWRSSRAAMLGAVVTAAIWAMRDGIYGWQHRSDWEHIRNYPLWIHAVLMTFSGVVYALVAFLPALAGVALSCRLSRRQA
jgi:hypothetical protein